MQAFLSFALNDDDNMSWHVILSSSDSMNKIHAKTKLSTLYTCTLFSLPFNGYNTLFKGENSNRGAELESGKSRLRYLETKSCTCMIHSLNLCWV